MYPTSGWRWVHSVLMPPSQISHQRHSWGNEKWMVTVSILIAIGLLWAVLMKVALVLNLNEQQSLHKFKTTSMEASSCCSYNAASPQNLSMSWGNSVDLNGTFKVLTLKLFICSSLLCLWTFTCFEMFSCSHHTPLYAVHHPNNPYLFKVCIAIRIRYNNESMRKGEQPISIIGAFPFSPLTCRVLSGRLWQ